MSLEMDPHAAAFDLAVPQLYSWLAQREAIVARVDALLNCQKKPIEYQQDLRLFTRLFRECFSGVARDSVGVVEQLEQAHWSSGFTPRTTPGNDLVEPVQMLLRALHLWRQTRWPGQKGRLRFAHTLFNLQLLRCLALLTMRLWDGAEANAAVRLKQLQALLDELWSKTPADQPRLVRDIRWLIPVVLSPTTDALGGYFSVAAKIAQTFGDDDRLEVQKAWVQTGAGHLCAQLRHLCVQRGVALAEHELVLLTRRSNALDVALLLEGLVTLLDAYERSLSAHDGDRRAALAVAICQGLSPDPQLFLERLDLIGPYTMIETVFITHDASGRAAYTPAGKRHLELVEAYRILVTRLAAPLLEDCQRCRPTEQGYAPCGALFGFSSNLLELMAFKTLQLESDIRFSLEDIFTPGDAAKRSWVNDWRRLPHINPEVVQQFQYPQDHVAALHERLEQALQRRVAADPLSDARSVGRLLIVDAAQEAVDPAQQRFADLPTRYVLSSDAAVVEAGMATAKDAEDLLHCRMEGEFLVSWPTPGGWAALDKDLLTELVGTGTDAKIVGLPEDAAAILGLMYPGSSCS